MAQKLHYIGICALVIGTALISMSFSEPPESFEYYQTGSIKGELIVKNPRQKQASLTDGVQRFQLQNTHESEKIYTDFEFNALIMRWKEDKPFGTAATIEMRFKELEGWSKWEDIRGNHDHQHHHHGEFEDQILFTQEATAFQYRINTQSVSDRVTPTISQISFEYIKNNEELLKNRRLLASSITPLDHKNILARSDWGADEKFTYKSFVEEEKPYGEHADNFVRDRNGHLKDDKVPIVRTVTHDPNSQEELRWKLQYPDKVSKIIVHHTASNKDVKRPLVALRNIYYYHSVSKKWGDIGYNYLIDQYGNIYEGRKGGDGVVGGHAHPFNRGTIGIALLGNFDNEQPSFEMTSSLIRLLKILTEKHGIDPLGTSKFNDQVLNNIMGHSDVNSTSCPGDVMKRNLPAIRSVVAELKGNSKLIAAGNETPEYNFDVISEISPVLIPANSEKKLSFQLKNTGTENWNNETFLVANINAENHNHIEFPENALQQETVVRPGEVGTFTVTMKSGVKSGFLNFDFTLIYDGEKKRSKYFSLPVYIDKANDRYIIESHEQSSDQLEYGEQANGTIAVLNDGAITWQQSGPHAVKLIFDDPPWKQSDLMPQGELVLATMQESSVAPGEIAHFNYTLTAPHRSQQFNEKLAIHHESIGKLSGEAVTLSLTVGTPEPTADLITVAHDQNMNAGEQKTITVKLKNTGQNTWHKSGDAQVTMVTIAHPAVGIPQELQFNEDQVGAGEYAHFSLPVTAPQESGSYTIRSILWQYAKRITPQPVEFTLFVGETIQPQRQDKAIRIKMSFNEPQIEVSSTQNFTASAGNENLISLNAGSTASVEYAAGKYQLNVAGKKIVSDTPIRFAAPNGVIEVLNMNKRPAWNPAINDSKFRGIIEARWYAGKLNLINELPLEDYVKGIGEVPNSEPYEKIKAMMVLARTYAKYYRDKDEKFPGAPYHLSDDPNESQKYLGYNFELRAPRVAQAVQETRNKVVTYNGELIKTPYFNSSAGHTLSAQEVWGWTHTPYLQSVEDPLCTEGIQRGHGVGLSGCGATAAAKIGKSYEEIIKYYYQGVEISQ